ncbi:MAG: tape measure protein, partial [Shewanella sp.]
MSFKDQVVNLIIQGKDLFTSEAKKSEKALQELGAQSENLNEQLNELKDQQAAIKAIDDLTSAISNGEGKYVDSAKALDQLKQQQRAVTAESKALDKAQATAAAATAKLTAEYSQTTAELSQYDARLSAARAEVERLTATQDKGAKASKDQAHALSTAKEDLQKLETAQKNTETSANALGAALEKQSSELKQLGVDVDNAAQKKAEYALQVKSASTAVTQLGNSLGRNKAELEKQQTVLNKAGIDMDKLADASKDLKTQQAAAELALKGVNDKLSRHNKLLDESKKSSSDFGGSIKAATGSLLAMAGAYVGVDRLWESLKSILTAGDKAAAFSAQMTAMMGSIAAGEQATAWIKDFANRTGTELEGAKQAFASLKTFGIDPMTGALQAMVDYNAKLGGSQEKLEGIILAVGQAWAKQKLQGEEILQLVERGVPVWDLLAKVTGKNSIELAKLSEQGKLGRDVMQKLFDEMGKQANGQASKSLERLGGQIALISNKWTEFKQIIADSGAYKVAVDLLQQLNAKFDELNKNGKIKEIAQQISDFFSDMLKNGGDSLKLMLENISAFSAGLNIVAGGIRLVFNTATSALYTLAQAATKSLEVMIRATASLFETVGADEIAKKQREAADAMAAVSAAFKKAVEQDARDATAALRQMGVEVDLTSDGTTKTQVDNADKVKKSAVDQIEAVIAARQKDINQLTEAKAAAETEIALWEKRKTVADAHYLALKTSA